MNEYMIKRIREASKPVYIEAADEIERLRETLKDALGFIKSHSYRCDDFNGEHPKHIIKKIRAALKECDHD